MSAAGGDHSMSLTAGGHALSWGCSGSLAQGYGRLGHGDNEHQLLPKAIGALQDLHVVDAAAGSFHSVVRLESGEVRRTNENASDGWVCLPPATK